MKLKMGDQYEAKGWESVRGRVKGLSVSRVGVRLGPEFSLCLLPGNEVTFCVNQTAPPSYAQTRKHHQSEISEPLGWGSTLPHFQLWILPGHSFREPVLS